MKDPVTKDLTEWINRSAGQHQRYLSEGTASARRLKSLPSQTEQQADDLKKWRASVIANGLLHRVDASQIGKRDGVSVGACRTDLPVEYAGLEPVEFDETEPLMTWTELFVIVLIVGAVLGLALKFYTP